MISKLTAKFNISLMLLVGALLLVTGCDVVPLHMRQQPKYQPLEASALWTDGMASRPLPANTVPRGEWGEYQLQPVFFTGRVAEDQFVQTIPVEVTRSMLQQGQNQFNIFCAPCHGNAGYGDGTIVQRGFRQPPSLHDQRLRDVEDGYIYDVIGNGFGTMYGYGSRIRPEDRWAVVAYVRALQFSQEVPLDSLPEEVQTQAQEQLR